MAKAHLKFQLRRVMPVMSSKRKAWPFPLRERAVQLGATREVRESRNKPVTGQPVVSGQKRAPERDPGH